MRVNKAASSGRVAVALWVQSRLSDFSPPFKPPCANFLPYKDASKNTFYDANTDASSGDGQALQLMQQP